MYRNQRIFFISVSILPRSSIHNLQVVTYQFLNSASELNIVVGHRTDTGVGPYVFGRFHHIDDGIDGQDDAKDGNRGTDARHERE